MASRKPTPKRKVVAATKAATTQAKQRSAARTKKIAPEVPAIPFEHYERTLALQRHLAVWYILQALAILIAAKSYSVALQVPFLMKNSLTVTDTVTYSPAYWQALYIPIGWLLAGSLLVLGLVQFLAATRFKHTYLASLEMGRHHVRSLTFIIGMTATAWLLALLFGLGSLPMLLLLFVAVVTAALALHMYDRLQALPSTLLAGWLAGAVALLIFLGVPLGSYIWGDAAPMYVYGLLTTLVLYAVSVVLLVWRANKQSNDQVQRLRTERSLGLALFGVQSLIAWQIFLGVLV